MTETRVTAISVVGRGNVNAYLVVGRKAVLIDTGMPRTGPKILAAMARHGLGPDDISAIVITHGHIDHFGSAVHLRQATGAPIIAHPADSDAYSSGRNPAALLTPTGPFGRLFAKFPQVHQHTQSFDPDIQVDESMSLHEFGVDARVLHTPGHTPGSISILTGPGELIAGDMIAGPFLGTIRRRPANPPFHYDRTHNLTSLRAALALDPTIIHVGHGGPLDPSTVRQWISREQHRLDHPPGERLRL